VAYLYPPPEPAPVVIVRDTGGLVADYKRQTEIYRAQGREIRLHECRSACTLALSLPNVCVYPHSVLRFHQAYNRDTREIDHRVSDELFASYPQAIRQRLGYLTRKYKSLSGEELISLGVRNCNESPVLHARRNSRGQTQIAQAPAPSSGEGAATAQPGLMRRLASGIGGLFGAGETRPAHTNTQIARAPSAPKIALQATSTAIPLPPPRPRLQLDEMPVASIAPRQLEETAHAPTAQPAISAAVPLPPPRPAKLSTSGSVYAQLPRLIKGAYPVLPPGLSAYAPLR